jgi:hypothetical protein
MGLAAYAIIGSGGEWRIRHDGKVENVYQTNESAFSDSSSLVGPQTSHEVQISAPGSATATGAADAG